MAITTVITNRGNALLSKVLAGESLVLTRVMVGVGILPPNQPAEELHGLITPFGSATSTPPVSTDSYINIDIEYRNDLNGGQGEDVTITEFGIYAQDPDEGEILLYYCHLNPGKSVEAFTGGAMDSLRFTAIMTLTGKASIIAEYPKLSYMTADEITFWARNTLVPNLKEEIPTGELTLYSENEKNYYDRGVFRIVFYRTGDDAVPGADQEVPDYVYDVSSAYVVAYYAFTELLKLRSPFLSSTRFYSGRQPEYIRALLTRANGTGSSAYRVPNLGTDGRYYLPISQAISDNPSVITPLHELFHLFQYGYSILGNGWYLEGLARASQDIFAIREAVTGAGVYVKRSKQNILETLENPNLFAEVSAKSYTAANFFWHPLFELLPEVTINRSDPYFQIKRRTSGDHIFSDWRMSWPSNLNIFFQYLEEETERLYGERGYTSWVSDNYSLAGNNRYITRALKRFIKEVV